MKLVNRTLVRGYVAIAAITTCAAGSVRGAGEVQYDLRLLSPPPGLTHSIRPNAINNAGAIVGGDPWSTLDSPAVRWEPGATVASRLTGQGGVNSLGNTQDAARGINDSGAIVGWGLSADGQSMRALRWDPGATAATDIGGGGTHSQAFDINNAGAVVGRGFVAVTSGSGRRPVYWAPGAMSFTVLPGGANNGVDSHVYGVNDAGILVGEVQGHAGGLAVRWSPPYANFQYLPDLPGQPVTHSTDINASGIVVGYVSRNSGLTHHGFRYDPTIDAMSELLGRPGIDPINGGPGVGTLNVFASAVNADGVAVRRAGLIFQEHAVMWLPGSTDAVDLNSLIDPASGWELTNAWDINDAGQIIGQAKSAGGGFGYYVLTPVPEPAVLGPVIVVLAAARPRRRGGVDTPSDVARREVCLLHP